MLYQLSYSRHKTGAYVQTAPARVKPKGPPIARAGGISGRSGRFGELFPDLGRSPAITPGEDIMTQSSKFMRHGLLAGAVIAIGMAGYAGSAAAYADTCNLNSARQANFGSQPAEFTFATGNAKVTPQQDTQLKVMVDQAKKLFVQQICVLGYADKQGNAESNKKLSLRRAENIAAVLRKHGWTTAKTYIGAQGEPLPMETKLSNDAKSQADRIVRVIFSN